MAGRWSGRPTPTVPMSVLSRSLFLVALAFVAGCTMFRPVADVIDLPETTDRPGSIGVRDSVRYVVHISVDGLRPDAVERVPSIGFTRLRTEGAWTHNARTDADYSITLPNHSAQLTGRPVVGENGHGWTTNVDPAPGETLHSNRGAYVASAFDVAHDHGLSTAAYVSKSKFSLFNVSYDDEHGARDTTGADDGRDKIDTFVFDPDTDALVGRLIDQLTTDPAAYTFVHLRDPDSAGHLFTWSLRRGSRYLSAVERADALVARVLEAVEADPRLAGRTALVVTADHGGTGRFHDAKRPGNYTVPFYVWSPGVRRADLYALNEGLRADPGTAQIPFSAERQPIRNGDAANLSLALLGLPPVPGSTIGAAVPLRVRRDVAVTVDPTGAPAGESAAPRDTVDTDRQ